MFVATTHFVSGVVAIVETVGVKHAVVKTFGVAVVAVVVSFVVLVGVAIRVAVVVLAVVGVIFVVVVSKVDGFRWLLFGRVVVWMRSKHAEDGQTHFVEIFWLVV